jgi:hypothetical protein
MGGDFVNGVVRDLHSGAECSNALEVLIDFLSCEIDIIIIHGFVQLVFGVAILHVADGQVQLILGAKVYIIL